ncbi:MAG: hypothetical protein P0Y59_08420 [Candidatus Sphingomonas phytovorans]|nr:hypothetical protein [Sphingomonas sp.]WEK01683.1 MAG: hypothetical protein P0Y59_08420 [Sphingomonas sp.]
MTRILASALLAGSALALSACVAGLAVGAAGMAARGVAGTPQNNEQAHPAATTDCSARASHYGKVSIIDVEQRSPSKIVVWGTADDGKQRRSFECSYGTKITGFKLRPIASAR